MHKSLRVRGYGQVNDCNDFSYTTKFLRCWRNLFYGSIWKLIYLASSLGLLAFLVQGLSLFLVQDLQAIEVLLLNLTVFGCSICLLLIFIDEIIRRNGLH